MASEQDRRVLAERIEEIIRRHSNQINDHWWRTASIPEIIAEIVAVLQVEGQMIGGGGPKSRALHPDEKLARAEALADARHRERDASRWPSGCIKPSACARHAGCMYARSAGQCRHYGADLTADIEAARATGGGA